MCLIPTVFGTQRTRGSNVFHLGSASFFALGAILVFFVLCVSTPCMPSTENFTRSSSILSRSAVVI